MRGLPKTDHGACFGPARSPRRSARAPSFTWAGGRRWTRRWRVSHAPGTSCAFARGCTCAPSRPVSGRCSPRIGKAIETLSALWGETHRPLRRLRRKPPGSDRPESGTGGLPDVRTESSSDVRRDRRRTASRAPLAAAGAAAARPATSFGPSPGSGPQETDDGLDAVWPALSAEERAELAGARAVLPAWMAESVSARLVHG